MPTFSSSASAVATRPAIRPTSAAAASCSDFAVPSWLSVGLGGGGGAASAGPAEPTRTTTAVTTPASSARSGRPAAGRQEPGRRGVAGPDGRREDMDSLPGEEGGAVGGTAPEESQRHLQSQRQHAAHPTHPNEFVK